VISTVTRDATEQLLRSIAGFVPPIHKDDKRKLSMATNGMSGSAQQPPPATPTPLEWHGAQSGLRVSAFSPNAFQAVNYER